MSDIVTRSAGIAALAVSFAVFLSLTVVLSGGHDGAGLTAAFVAGALAVSTVVSGRPLHALRTLTPDARGSALAGGALAVFAAPAIICGVRLSDAPAGSVVVFWVAGGWAALTALAAAVLATRSGMRGAAPLLMSCAALAFGGAAAVVANWERPSSFSPFVRFPAAGFAIFAAGALLIAGGMLLARAGRLGNRDGAVLTGSLSASAAALVWLVVSGPTQALTSIGELPLPVALAAAAWGVCCVTLPRILEAPGHGGLAQVAAALLLAPALMSALTWVEQAVGVAGPQPFVIPGLVAGVATLAAAAAGLLVAARGSADSARVPPLITAIAVLPLVASLVSLAVPAIAATVHVASDPTFFDGSWTMPGAESVAGWVAVGLAGLLLGLVIDGRRTAVAPLVGAAAGVAWFLLRDVPTHVLNDWLSPAVQSYYGTEYGRIGFSAVPNAPMLFAVAAATVGFLALALANSLQSRSVIADTITHNPED